MSCILLLLSLFFTPLHGYVDLILPDEERVVVVTKRILVPGFPAAFNPSLFRLEEGFLLSFRYSPDPNEDNCRSFIGVVLLDENLEIASSAALLHTRCELDKTHSMSEDARIFLFKGRICLVYNDLRENPHHLREMFLSELSFNGDTLSLSSPLRLSYPGKQSHFYHQKNWMPFEWNNALLLSYTLNPHEVLSLDFRTGCCHLHSLTQQPISWNFGSLRGGAPPQLVDGEYLGFFHSGIPTTSAASQEQKRWHYFMGAYTFSPDPPFQLTKVSPMPIFGKDFYTASDAEKRVVFPGGFAVCGPWIHLAYGKDDREIWIATLDKEELKKHLKRIN